MFIKVECYDDLCDNVPMLVWLLVYLFSLGSHWSGMGFAAIPVGVIVKSTTLQKQFSCSAIGWIGSHGYKHPYYPTAVWKSSCNFFSAGVAWMGSSCTAKNHMWFEQECNAIFVQITCGSRITSVGIGTQKVFKLHITSYCIVLKSQKIIVLKRHR